MSASRGGILPAVVTPFDEAGRFKPEALERLLARLYGAGVHGVYVCGSTGEGMLQSTGQRMSVVETAVRMSPPSAKVVVHVGAASLAEAALLARHARRSGATAVSSLPPVGGFAFAEIRAYYARLALEAELPLLIYHYPEMTAAPLELGQLLELCALPGVAGIKLTDFNLFRLWALKQEGVTVFNGRDEVLLPGLLMGADGGIGTFYNLLPAEVVQMYALARRGEWEAARRAQHRLNVLIRVVSRYPLFPAVKQILAWSGIDCGPCLPPRGELTREQVSALRADLDRAELTELLLRGPCA